MMKQENMEGSYCLFMCHKGRGSHPHARRALNSSPGDSGAL